MKCGDAASARIMEKLWQGTLPTDEPVKLRVGLGSGLKCAGCEVPILPSEPEHEVEMTDGRTLHFHVDCACLWRVLKQAQPKP
jgi:hypothetical protein